MTQDEKYYCDHASPRISHWGKDLLAHPSTFKLPPIRPGQVPKLPPPRTRSIAYKPEPKPSPVKPAIKPSNKPAVAQATPQPRIVKTKKINC